MIGIKSIRSYVPTESTDNLEQALRFNETEAFIRDKIGALTLPVKSPIQDTSDLALLAVKNLIDQDDLAPERLDALVVVTQNGDGEGLPHTSAVLQGKLGLPTHVAAFDISLGCSGYVYGLSVLRGIMEQANLKNGILVTADPYSKIVDHDDRNTALIFGDAATATWLCEGGPWTFGVPLLATDGSGSENLYKKNGKLIMNGRQVFNFASKQVPIQISQWLQGNKMQANDIDLFCLHQGSAFIVETIAKKFPAVQERFIKDILTTGNTISSSIPLLLEKHVLPSDKINSVLVSGFGVGLSWATNGLFRTK